MAKFWKIFSPIRASAWFDIRAIVPPLWVLFSFACGLFARAAMNCIVELLLLIIAASGIAALTWFGAAKTLQEARDAREAQNDAQKDAREAHNKLDTLIQLISKPETTLDDIKKMASGLDLMYADTPLPMRTITSPALWDYQSRHNQVRPDIDPNAQDSQNDDAT